MPFGTQEIGIPVMYVAALPQGPLVVLTDMAALIWLEAFEGPEGSLPTRVADRFDEGVDASQIEADVIAFVQSLLDQGLLERAGADGDASAPD